MATVDFLPFAIGGGANVLDQADYAALPAVSTGYVAGTAISEQLNKTWRQSSFQAAVVANFVSQALNADVLDDGDLSTAISQFFAAIRATVSSGAKWSGTSGGSANTQTLTPSIPATSYVAGESFSFIAGFSNSGALTINVSALGAKSVYKAGSGGPVALAGGEVNAGSLYVIRYNGTQFQLDATSLGTMSVQDASAVAITGGTINGAPIGGSATAAGAFTTLSASGQFTSTVTTGTAPLVVASTTAVANLNASLLLGQTWAIPGAIGGTTPGSGAFTTISATGQITSTLAQGNAPFVVTSTTLVAGLNAQYVGGTAVTGLLLVANNLSDVANAGTARSNLGLGTMSTQAAGAVAITGGTINGAVIGGTINGAVIGGSSAAAGTFTALTDTALGQGPVISSSGGALANGGVLFLQDQEPSGTGPGNLTGTTWNTRVLNQKVVDSIGSVLSSNTFTLPAGIYVLRASASAVNCNHQIRLYNVTDSAATALGSNSTSPIANTTNSIIDCAFTITGSKTFEIGHWVSSTQAGGIAISSGTSEIYTQVMVEKIG